MFGRSERGRGRRWSSLAAAGMLVLIAAGPSDSPVADAAERGDLETVRSLLREGADVNAAQPDGMTALHWAAVEDRADMIEVLVYAGAALKATTRLGGYTPLHLAGRSGREAAIRALLEAGSDPNAFTTTGVTTLHFAAEANSAGSIQALVEHGAEVDARDVFMGRTPLMFASARDAAHAVRALLAAGADPAAMTDIKDYEQIAERDQEERARRNRIRRAAEEPEEDEEEEERARAAARARAPRTPGTPPDTAAQNTPPDSANPAEPEEEEAEEPEEPEKEPEIKSLSSIEQIGKQGGFTALHFAAREGHVETAMELLEAGADVNQVTGGDQSSPLLVAVINGHYDLAKKLLEAGADPNLVSDDGVGPLFATLNIEWSLRTWYPQPGAFRRQTTSYMELLELLLEAGADPNQRTSTHVWYASYNAGRMGVDFTGATPFWRAAYAADVPAMKLLASYGADPNIWTYNLVRQNRFRREEPDTTSDEPEMDPSGLPPVPHGGPGIHPVHAASGVGFGTSRVAQQHRSAPGGWLESMKYLVGELGVDPNLRDKDGYTPVHHAAARGDNETILYLVSQGADVTLISRRGQTTADLANSPEQRAQPHPATVALLEKLGSKNNHNCRSCGTGR